jgi:hypothetical protein
MTKQELVLKALRRETCPFGEHSRMFGAHPAALA